MRQRLRRIRATIQDRFPESRLAPVTDQQMASLTEQFPDLPDHLARFFTEVGCGCVGDSRYMIYALISPEDIFDRKTAAGLSGKFLIGDDFAGQHEAYDVSAGWRFGYTTAGGRFETHDQHETFIDFIEDWFVKADD